MSDIFNPDDEKLLDLTMGLRERLVRKINKLDEEKLPIKPSDLLAITSLVDSVDKTVIAKAKLRLDDSAAKSQEADSAVLRQLMMQLHSAPPAALPDRGEPRALPGYVSQNLDIKPGELIGSTDNTSVPS